VDDHIHLKPKHLPVDGPDAYHPGIFDVPNLGAARAIILTPEGEESTDRRWVRETPWLIERMCTEWASSLGPDSVVLDFGCGVGRLAKELIKRTGCRVIGADISPSMRALAAVYVDDSRFVAVHPEALSLFAPLVTHALAVWVLQHVYDVSAALGQMASVMQDGANLFVCNNNGRAVPARGGRWSQDWQSVEGALEAADFAAISDDTPIPLSVTSRVVHENAWTGFFTLLRR
jgi:SAM-dependent methyltransferase